MPLSQEDLEREADDMFKDRRIAHAVRCGRCGYNLKTLPYIGQCPECGNEYNARPMSMKGIFNACEGGFPFRSFFGAFVGAAGAVVMASWALDPLDLVGLLLTAIFLWMALMYFWSGCSGVMRMFRAISIRRRIRMEEQQEED